MADSSNMMDLRDTVATASMKYAGCASEDDESTMKCRVHGVHWSSRGICLAMLAHANDVLLPILESIENAAKKADSSRLIIESDLSESAN